MKKEPSLRHLKRSRRRGRVMTLIAYSFTLTRKALTLGIFAALAYGSVTYAIPALGDSLQNLLP